MDVAWFRFLNQGATTPSLAGLATFVSSPWMLVLFVAPIVVYHLIRRRFITVLSIALAFGVCDLLTVRVLKPWFDRDRPCRVLPETHQPTGCGTGRSFPSAHASNAFAIATSAAPTVRFGWIALFPAAVVVSVSRVILGVHYPSDVTAGAMLGALIGGLTLWGRTKLERFCELRRSSPGHSHRGPTSGPTCPRQ